MKAIHRYSRPGTPARKRARKLRERQNRQAVRIAIRMGSDVMPSRTSILYDIS